MAGSGSLPAHVLRDKPCIDHAAIPHDYHQDFALLLQAL
jgi:hypothetical protein